MKKYFALTCTLAVLNTTPLIAKTKVEIDDPCKTPKVVGREAAYTDIYPFQPVKAECLKHKLERLTESTNYVTDLREIGRRNLLSATTAVQPWGGSYWPMNQGLIANTYQDKNYVARGVFSGLEVLSWKYNYNKFLKRKDKVHAKIDELDEKELAELAPSEKYDLLLGDKSFDFTNRSWAYAKLWGDKRHNGFLSSIDMPEGYKIPDPKGEMKSWEGICHGWAVASGHSARPEKTVTVTLPNGKRMPFYPNDLKALISVMWANSTVQDAVISEGLRCNKSSPKKDEFGRFIDTEIDRNDGEFLPRCADVHPAVYHAAIINILGIEGRSFVVDKSSKANVSNQPVSGYEYSYYNPADGKEGTLLASALKIEDYTTDPFRAARSPEARFIVGVDMTLMYVDWEYPTLSETNFASDDKISDFQFNYDLELDKDYKIVGGQWRVKRDGSSRTFKNVTQQPDFFWVVPKDYKKFFKPNANLPAWNFDQSTVPPKEYKAAALGAHSFVYQMTREFGWKEKCQVVPQIGNGPVLKVDCEYKYPRPQPLINVVDKLLEESRR